MDLEKTKVDEEELSTVKSHLNRLVSIHVFVVNIKADSCSYGNCFLGQVFLLYLQGFKSADVKTEDMRNLVVMAMKGEFPDVPGPVVNAIEEKINMKVCSMK